MKKSQDSFAALKFAPFRFFILFKICTTIAVQTQSTLIGWQMYSLTKDPLSLGLIGLVEIIPNLLVILFAGMLADRINRKSILLVCVLILASNSFFLSQYNSNISHYYLYLNVALTGLSRGLISPAASALMADTVPERLYANSSTWNSTLWQLAAVLGSGSAGFLLNALGFAHSYLFCFGFFFLSMLFILLIPYTFKKIHHHHLPIFKGIKEGIEFVFKDQRFLGSFTLDLFAVLFGGATILLPVFASEVLFLDAKALGILRAAPFFGALLMAFFLTRYPILERPGKILLISVFCFGLSMIGFALSTNFFLSLFFLFASGAFDNISVVTRTTIVQMLTPHHLRGRVASVNSIFISSSNELGALESGIAAKYLGTVPSVVFGGMLTLLVVFIISFKFPKLKNLDLTKHLSP